MAEGFKPGDIVQLKSGGPPMTVEKQSDYAEDLVCVWFKGASKERSNFMPDVLKSYEPPKKND